MKDSDTTVTVTVNGSTEAGNPHYPLEVMNGAKLLRTMPASSHKWGLALQSIQRRPEALDGQLTNRPRLRSVGLHHLN